VKQMGSTEPFCCDVRRRLAEKFAIATRLYDAAVVSYTGFDGTRSEAEYARLRNAAADLAEVRRRSQAASACVSRYKRYFGSITKADLLIPCMRSTWTESGDILGRHRVAGDTRGLGIPAVKETTALT